MEGYPSRCGYPLAPGFPEDVAVKVAGGAVHREALDPQCRFLLEARPGAGGAVEYRISLPGGFRVEGLPPARVMARLLREPLGRWTPLEGPVKLALAIRRARVSVAGLTPYKVDSRLLSGDGRARLSPPVRPGTAAWRLLDALASLVEEWLAGGGRLTATVYPPPALEAARGLVSLRALAGGGSGAYWAKAVGVLRDHEVIETVPRRGARVRLDSELFYYYVALRPRRYPRLAGELPGLLFSPANPGGAPA